MMVTRLSGVRAVVGRIPTGFGPDLLCGELRTDDDRPAWLGGERYGEAGCAGLLVAPATARGMGLLLAGLERLASSRPVRAVRRAG